jgi:diaminopimelate decarboxylase
VQVACLPVARVLLNLHLMSHDELRWRERVSRAVTAVGTPCYVAAWPPVAAALERLAAATRSTVPVRSWLSFKTNPLPALASAWLRSGRGVEVVSEAELATLIRSGCRTEQLLVNGVAKHAWLTRWAVPRLRVHFDSVLELERLLPQALAHEWRVGVRCHVPDERDARDPRFGGQFGMSRDEAVASLRRLRRCGADVQSIHFHLGQSRQDGGAFQRAVAFVAAVCAEADVEVPVVDYGGGLPSPSDSGCDESLADLGAAIRSAPDLFPALREVWLENGRYMTEGAMALAVSVVDVKERPEGRYAICDGGRTNQALAADHGAHPVLTVPERDGRERLTTICGPTCMTDDRLGRWTMRGLEIGDLVVWRDAGAYHLPWETRFSQPLCAVVWFDRDESLVIARERESADTWAERWSVSEVCGHA